MKDIVILGPNGAGKTTAAEQGRRMRSMTSREIHVSIKLALDEVSHGLWSGQLDRSGRFYSDPEWKALLTSQELRKPLRPSDQRNTAGLTRGLPEP